MLNQKILLFCHELENWLNQARFVLIFMAKDVLGLVVLVFANLYKSTFCVFRWNSTYILDIEHKMLHQVMVFCPLAYGTHIYICSSVVCYTCVHRAPFRAKGVSFELAIFGFKWKPSAITRQSRLLFIHHERVQLIILQSRVMIALAAWPWKHL